MRKLLFIVIAIPVLIWAGWRMMFPAYDWQQTLTFYITTPDGPVIASNTGHARWRSGPKILPDAGAGAWSYDGEALVAELGSGKYLFSLLDNNLSLGRLIGVRNGSLDRRMDQDTRSRHILRSRGEVWDVPFDLLPPLVTFDDVNDMDTLSFVDPNDLSATLGSGYALEKVTFAITREPTTIGRLDQFRIAWFVAPQRGYYEFQTDDELGIRHINGANFWQGDAALRFLERQQ